MPGQDIKLLILPRGRPVKAMPLEVSLPHSSSTHDLYQQLSRASGLSTHRIRVTKASDNRLVSLSDDITVSKTGLLDGSKIYVKDLGPQISWRVVYVAEYIGPLIIHPLIYGFRSSLYQQLPEPFVHHNIPPPSVAQFLTMALITIHFLKREFETLFVHRFSNATMPASYIARNSAYYWFLAGIFIAFPVYSPSAQAAGNYSVVILASGVILYIFGELGNLKTHLVLRNLRRPGGKERGIPRGPGFPLVTCPNYLFEAVAWIGLTLISMSWATALFTIVAIVQMGIWAKKKERAYRRDFGEKYKPKSYGVLPGII